MNKMRVRKGVCKNLEDMTHTLQKKSLRTLATNSSNAENLI